MEDKEKAIKIPQRVIESLLADPKNTAVIDEIRRIAEDEAPEKFKTHRHGLK